MSHRCDRYSIVWLPGVEFCRKAGAQVVAERLIDLKARTEKAERDLQETTDSLAARILKCATLDKALAAAQAEIVELKDKLTGRDEYNHELKLAKNAAQARERELRRVVAKGPHRDGCDMWRRVKEGESTQCNCEVGRALSAPQDDSSLREFGRKCIEAAGLHDEPRAVVDAVLKGAE